MTERITVLNNRTIPRLEFLMSYLAV